MANNQSKLPRFTKFKKDFSSLAEAHRQYADQLYRLGEFKKAASHFQQAAEHESLKNIEKRLNDQNRTAACYYALKDFKQASEFIGKAVDLNKKNHFLLTNYGIILIQIGEYKKAEVQLLNSLKINPNFLPTLDALARLYSRYGNKNNVKDYGLKSLQLKDLVANDKKNVTHLNGLIREKFEITKRIPKFNSATPDKNIIAFSVYGDQLQYLNGAIINAQLAPIIYPGWRCRFYVDKTVPTKAIEKLKSLNAQVVMMPKSDKAYYGNFWRFLVANDPDVDFFLIRDADSLINCQERVAVDDWLTSNKHFHIMRDWYTHSELILGGMWGGVAGVLPKLEPLIDDCYHQYFQDRTTDQLFLRYYIWPLIKSDYLAHDSKFGFGHYHEFPILGRFPNESHHVGQNWFGQAT